MPTRERTTPYAVLGMLGFGPMSGYDIRKQTESSLGYFWSESYGQVYPALHALAAARLIRRRPGARTGGRERVVYQITELGRDALRRWRAMPPRVAPMRSELLLKLFFGDRDSVGPEIAWVEQLLRDESRALAEFRKVKGELRRQGDHPSLPFWLVTLSFGEHRSRAIVRWCRETVKALRGVKQGVERKGRTQ